MAVEFCCSFRLLSLNSKERASADLSDISMLSAKSKPERKLKE
jgi:hypothetical protein